jgi:hypothetical protein
MGDKPYNEGRLSEAFDNAIANSRDSRIEDFYGTDLDASGIMDRSEHLARVIFHGAEDLVSDQSVARAQEELESLFAAPLTAEKELLVPHVYRVIDEQIGHAIVAMQASAESRFVKLVLLGTKALVDSRTADYLRRVSQCYLVGLDEQCVIMCRSALEAAFLESVPDRVCEEVPEMRKTPRAGRDRPEYSLDDRIRAASAKGIGDDGTLKMARFVKNVANDLVHPEREMRRKLDDNTMDMIVMETIKVIRALSGAPAG